MVGLLPLIASCMKKRWRWLYRWYCSFYVPISFITACYLTLLVCVVGSASSVCLRLFLVLFFSCFSTVVWCTGWHWWWMDWWRALMTGSNIGIGSIDYHFDLHHQYWYYNTWSSTCAVVMCYHNMWFNACHLLILPHGYACTFFIQHCTVVLARILQLQMHAPRRQGGGLPVGPACASHVLAKGLPMCDWGHIKKCK